MDAEWIDAGATRVWVEKGEVKASASQLFIYRRSQTGNKATATLAGTTQLAAAGIRAAFLSILT